MVGVAVKVTAVAKHEAPGELLIVTEGITVLAENESVIVLLVAFGALKQLPLLVNTQLTSSPETGEVKTYVDELAPTATPFLYHWNEGFVPPFVAEAV